MKVTPLIALLAFCIGSASVFADSLEKKVYRTQRVDPSPPVIDGRGDDSAWRKVAWEGNFVQNSFEKGVIE